MLRRYRVLKGRAALRALTTEAAVVLGDAVISRDLAALSGRVAGWRAASGLPARSAPSDALERGIGLRESLAWRVRIYGRSASA